VTHRRSEQITRAVVAGGTPKKAVDFRDGGQHVTLRLTCPDSLLLCATIFFYKNSLRAQAVAARSGILLDKHWLR